MNWLTQWFQLHPDWQQAWKWLQTQLGAVIVAAPVLYVQFPQYIQPYIGQKAFLTIMAILGLCVVLNSVRTKTPPSTPPAQ